MLVKLRQNIKILPVEKWDMSCPSEILSLKIIRM